jgi:hypothetical protein
MSKFPWLAHEINEKLKSNVGHLSGQGLKNSRIGCWGESLMSLLQ